MRASDIDGEGGGERGRRGGRRRGSLGTRYFPDPEIANGVIGVLARV